MSVTIGSGHEGNVREQVNTYVARVKGGEMGALPSVLSLFVLTLLQLHPLVQLLQLELLIPFELVA